MKSANNQQKKKKMMKMKTNMVGLRRWMDAHPRKNCAGYFVVNGKPLTHQEVVKVVDYCVSKGYRTEDELPDDELAALLNWEDKQ